MSCVLALALTKSVAPDNDRFVFRSDQKHIKMNLFLFNQRFSTKWSIKKVCYFTFLYFFLSFHDNMLEKSVFKHKMLLCLQYLYQ
jgi:hypothetical protein